MKPIIKDIRDITDSKEMYESKPHPFLSIFIYLLLALIIIACIWMYFGEIDIVSKGTGVVRPNTHLSSIRNKTAGEVVYCNIKEGQVVEKGEVLFSINYDNLEIGYKKAKEVLEEIEKEGNSLKKLRQSIEKEKNLFSKKNEKEDYEQYVKYVQDYEQLKNANHIEAKNQALSISQTEMNKTIYSDKIQQYEEDLKELEEYKASLYAKQSLFTNANSSKALEFKCYLYNVKQLEADIATKKAAYELNVSLSEENLVAVQELNDSKMLLELAEDELTTLGNKALSSIEIEIEEIQKNIQNLKQEDSKLIVDHQLINAKDEQRELALKKYRTDYLINLYTQIEENEATYKAQKKELESIELSIKNCEVVAPINGTVHIINKIAEGDLIASGDNIATIIPIQDNLYTIEIFIPNSEIAGIELGDTIKYKFDALPYKEYGELEGKITNISTDAQMNETYGISGYLIEGSIVNQTVYSYKGETADIKVGMTCEAHVITQQKKILHYLLEKINLKE